jgi:hypothetical protein
MGSVADSRLVGWILIVGGITFAEYLSHNPDDQYWDRGIPPEFYFWKWSARDPIAPVRTFEPTWQSRIDLQMLLWTGPQRAVGLQYVDHTFFEAGFACPRIWTSVYLLITH